MRNVSLLMALGVALLFPAFGQTPAASRPIDNEFVQKQFGNQFTLLPQGGVAVGDLDGDGVEDVVIAARCKSPMLDQAEHNFTVVDPYYEYFGYGDPKTTTTFSEGDPARRGMVVLVIYGTGHDTWRSATPKAKFVIVNLPYQTISVRKIQIRKKTIEAIYGEESGDTTEQNSAIFFDGKKFHYVPMGGDMH